MNPTRGAPNGAESWRLILSVILGVHSHHDSGGENPIRTWATCLSPSFRPQACQLVTRGLNGPARERQLGFVD
jgi:hypothetical protein